jgi:hypothetical protein
MFVFNINGNFTETFLFYSYSIADPTSQVCTAVCVFGSGKIGLRR